MREMIDFDAAPVFAIPLLEPYRDAGTCTGMLLEGPQGWGEFSPPADCDDQEIVRWLTAAIEVGTVGWPDPVRGRVPIAVSVPAIDSSAAHELTAHAGCATAEVTVAAHRDSLAADIARVEAVRAALGPAGAIRVVAAGRWDVDTAVRAIAALSTAAGGLEYVEQPCRTEPELAAVRRQVDVRIAADPTGISVAHAADIAVLRTGPMGGARRALRVAETSGLPCVVSSTLETSIGLAAGLALAGALPDLPFACALGTRSLLAGDVVAASRSLMPAGGYLPVAPMPAAPDPALLARFTVTDDAVVRRWRERLRSIRIA
ncbi:MAG: o-succinylbenzoate synthase [Mycobacterium sp.]